LDWARNLLSSRQRTPVGEIAYKVTSLDTPAQTPTPQATPPVPGETVVQLDGVTVIYGKNQALKGVDARFAPGAVGLLGPNGAGKSTMLKALLGFVKPAKGQMRVLGLDVATRPLEIRARIGYMPESDAHIPGMNAVSFVAYCGQLAGLPAVDAMQRSHEVLYYVGLGEARYRNVETYSTGMKQRIKLAQALVHDPDLLFLDEPTNGMDPKGRDEMLELIHDLGHNKHVNLILSSHLLPDVEYTCDHVVVMDKGQVVAQGPIAELKGPRGRVFELRIKGDLPAFLDVLQAAGLECHATDEDVMRVFVPADRVDDTGNDQKVLFTLAARHGVQVRHLRPSIPSLEDVFAKAVGEP
jgi:ABC-2 type transport system ATP-binding protein